jgi:hypothetical protein
MNKGMYVRLYNPGSSLMRVFGPYSKVILTYGSIRLFKGEYDKWIGTIHRNDSSEMYEYRGEMFSDAEIKTYSEGEEFPGYVSTWITEYEGEVW